MASFGLLGEKLSHSFSPAIHAQLGNYEYLLHEKTSQELGSFLRNVAFDGLNVTIPYKKAVIPYCKTLSDAAKAIGSVNTLLRNADGTLHGDNTDYYGFSYLLEQTKFRFEGGEKVLILGSGGSSLTVQAVLRDLGVSNALVVSRNGENNYQNIAKHYDAALIVNTTPVGMHPNCEKSPLESLAPFARCRTVIDLIYNPRRTKLLLEAEALGIPAFNGLPMLTAQAKKAAELFLGKNLCESTLQTVTAKIDGMESNILLIGMPGCGKTTIGKMLAEKTNRPFFDTDEEIQKQTGLHPSAIIQKEGEEVFRKMERAVLKSLCANQGAIIATGGGIVTCLENYPIMAQRGIIIFLNRDIAKLPTAERPLSQKIGIEALAEVRLPLYQKWCEYTVSAETTEGAVDEVINHILGGSL